MSNVTGDEGSYSSGEEVQQHQLQQHFHGSEPGSGSGSSSQQQQTPIQTAKRKRNLPGTPDPCAEVIALSPTTLMATNRFVCEICSKGFARDQNLQLHRRGHNLPWKLKQRISSEAKKRVYICPEETCVHHNPGRALGDLTGIKKHYSRKHGEKKWKCDKCSKRYAVQSDWKAHLKTCGTREYKCDCGTIFSRRDSFITHRAFCDALAEENNKVNQGLINNQIPNQLPRTSTNTSMVISEPNKYGTKSPLTKSLMATDMFSTSSGTLFGSQIQSLSSSSSGLQLSPNGLSSYNQLSGLAHMSATALLQKAAQMGATASNSINSPMMQRSFVTSMVGPDHGSYDNPSALVGINGGGFPTQLLQRDPQEAMGDMGMFSEILMGVDHGLIKNMGNEDSISNSSFIMEQGTMDRNSVRPSRLGGNGHDDTLTVDFLGVGGSKSSTLQQQRQKRNLNLEVMSQQRMQAMNPFQQHLPNSDSVNEKSMWDD